MIWAWRIIVAAFLVFMLGPILLVDPLLLRIQCIDRLPDGRADFRLVQQACGRYRLSFSILDESRRGAGGSDPRHGDRDAGGNRAHEAGARRRPRLFWRALSLPVLLPPLVVAIAIVVLIVRGLGLSLGLPVVVLGHILVAQPFVILIVMARLARFDQATVDAARDLGATRFMAFRLVTLPQIASALVGAALVSAAISLDDFIIASFTIGGGNTLSTFVWGKMRTTLDPSINAIATILLVLTVGLSALALRVSRYKG